MYLNVSTHERRLLYAPCIHVEVKIIGVKARQHVNLVCPSSIRNPRTPIHLLLAIISGSWCSTDRDSKYSNNHDQVPAD